MLVAVPETTIPTPSGEVPVYVAVPAGDGPWPGVVLVHDALGMTTDLRRQADWLAGEGYLAAAPNLYHWGGRLRCLVRTMRDSLAGEGRAYDDLDATRRWLVGRDDCTDRVGVLGFCMGGGFALVLASGWGYHAAAPNYGMLPKEQEALLDGACPVVASYGGRDPSLKGAAERLDRALDAAGVPHDVHEYPDAGHGFLNDHLPSETPAWARIAAPLARTAYHEPSAADARRRIVAFFERHLAG
jgi:carboxymethylenebutenolidase